MTLQNYDTELLKKQLKEIIFSQVPSSKVFFFGSRVVEKGTERSDIDVGILGTKAVPLEVLGKIKEQVENLPLLYKIDIIDFQRVSENFKQVALENIEIIE